MQEDSAVPSPSAGFASVALEKLRDEARSEKISGDFFSLITRAARGNIEAQSLVGEAYASGCGCPRNDARAEKWFRQAPNAGFAKARFGLATLLLKGFGVERNPDEAAQWLRKARKTPRACSNIWIMQPVSGHDALHEGIGHRDGESGIAVGRAPGHSWPR
jgi:TPR repeat protein